MEGNKTGGTAIVKVEIYKDSKLPTLDQMAEGLKLPECGAVGAF